MADHQPIWSPSACIPREEVLKGRLTDAELALRLSSIVKGEAKPPYNKPETFLSATHLTKNMITIIENVMGRLTGTKQDVNPIIVLDVGFGGGKTHTMATLYYLAKYGHKPEVSKFIKNITIPQKVNIVAISGEDYTEEGVIRDGATIKTIWGDMFWQLGKYNEYKTKDTERTIPSIDEMKKTLQDTPTLILLDELPTYLKTIANQKEMLDKAIQWIQRLVIAVSELEHTVLVVAIAEDVYRNEAEQTRKAIYENIREHMTEARAHIARKETVYVPIEEEDAVHILKRRLFEHISPEAAKTAAESYHKLYQSLPVVDELKSTEYKQRIQDYYPFHPHLIKVLYERLATLDRFQRTRGALRLLSRTIRRIWSQKEQDATLIHPFHIDLADRDTLTDLTTHIGEEKLRNAVEADVWKGDGTATAERLDEQAAANWGAPLVRRACNTIFLYSLTPGKEGDRGIRSDLLTSLLATPPKREHFMKVRDIVLNYLADQFHYIDKQGERFVFVREPTPIRVIDLLARDITQDEIIATIKEKLQNELFKPTKNTPHWMNIEFFPLSPSRLQDDTPTIQIGILNPNIHTIRDKSLDERVKDFLEFSDDQRQRPRKYANSTFLLVASEDRLAPLRLAAARVQAARKVRDDPQRYQIPKERKTDIEEYLARQEAALHDQIRAAFLNLIYSHKDGVKLHQIRDGSGYGTSSSGYEILRYILAKVIERISEEPLEPEYVDTHVWPQGAASITTKALHEWFHRKPGVKIPVKKEDLIETIKKGVEQNLWVLYRYGKLYDSQSITSIKDIPIDDSVEILTPEEAGKRKPPEPPKPPGGEGGGEPSPPEPPPIQIITLSDSHAEILASDLEKKAKSEKFSKIHKTVIKTSIPDTSYILELRNLLTRLAPVTTLHIRMNGTITRSRNPRYTITFELDKDSAKEESGKSLLENLWKLKGVESMELRLELSWSTPTKPEEVAKFLRTLGKDLTASIEAEVAI